MKDGWKYHLFVYIRLTLLDRVRNNWHEEWIRFTVLDETHIGVIRNVLDALSQCFPITYRINIVKEPIIIDDTGVEE